MKHLKKILAVTFDFHSGGSQSLAESIIGDLQTKGHTVYCAATHSTLGELSQRLKQKNVPCFALQFHKKNSITNNAITRFLKVLILLIQIKPDVIYIQHFRMYIPFHLPAKLMHIPRIIVTEHSNKHYQPDNPIMDTLRKITPYISGITLVHKRIASYFSDELKYPLDNIAIIPNGIDTLKFQPNDTLSRDAKIFTIGCVARLHDFKDHINLLRAVSILEKKNTSLPELQVILVGDGDMRETLENKVTELDLKTKVSFLGDRTDVEKIIPTFDLFVLPSKTEGFPIVLLEAMACEVPCVATDVGGVSIIFEDGGGSVIPKEDSVALSQSIAHYASLPHKELQLIGKQARAIVEKKYNDIDMLAAYENIIVKEHE